MEKFGIRFRIFPCFRCMIKRIAEERTRHLAQTFKAVAVTGPRQTGKTTLVKSIFKDKPYISLENPDQRNYAIEDPRGFLQQYAEGAILDEVQLVPSLFSYLQEVLDNSHQKGLFILSGSNNFLLHQNISQSLASRVGLQTLLPFSFNELYQSNQLPDSDDELMLKGFPPRSTIKKFHILIGYQITFKRISNEMFDK